jgi:protein-tyrosine phosphatase
VSKVTESIYLGAYPKFEKEIAELKNLGVKAVLSLQSKKDMRAFGINCQELSKVYEKYDIQAYNLEILDMKLKDFVNRSQRAVRLLRELIEDHGTVYVHCTAGIYRSPQLVALYLIQY